MIAVGFTVTVAVQVLLLPFTSTTVKVTVFGPWAVHAKLFGFAERLAMPQASLLPLSTWLAVMETLPLVGAVTVTS